MGTPLESINEAQECPCGIISTNRKSPVFSRGFKVSSLIFDPFPNQESSRKKRRIAGGVLLSTCNSLATRSFVLVSCGRFRLLKSSNEAPFFHAHDYHALNIFLSKSRACRGTKKFVRSCGLMTPGLYMWHREEQSMAWRV